MKLESIQKIHWEPIELNIVRFSFPYTVNSTICIFNDPQIIEISFCAFHTQVVFSLTRRALQLEFIFENSYRAENEFCWYFRSVVDIS